MKNNMRCLLSAAVFIVFSVIRVSAQDCSPKEVDAAVRSGNFEIAVDTIYPQAGMPVHDGGYSVKFSGGKVTTVLPFFGTSDTASFTHEDSSIVLDEVPVKLNKKKSKESWTLSFAARSGSNLWDIEIIVWDNGRCDLTCQCTSKSLMRYDGELVAGSTD